MPRNSAAPTHAWLIGNRIMRMFAWCFLVVVFVVVLTVAWTVGALDKECLVPVKKDFGPPGYWVHVEVGSMKLGCQLPPSY